MAFPSQKETYDSNTVKSHVSDGVLLYRRSPNEITTIQSDRASISNFSVHTTTTDAISEDQSNYTEQNPGGVPSNSDRKSLHSLEKPTFRFRNQSQSTIGTIREAGSIRNSTSSTHPPGIPPSEDEDLEASAPILPDSDSDEARVRAGRVLESKVARVASRNFSVEEVTALQKEVDHWLTEVTAADAVRVLSSSTNPSLTLPHPQSPALLSPALFLSSSLLKTILANHLVFSDASKVAKYTEMSLRSKVDELEFEKRRLELELEIEKGRLELELRE